MHLPPLPSPAFAGYYSSGDVTIAGDVVIASGVILRADPGYCIRLGEGVCVGLGAILHANQGNILVQAGTILGAGVLVIGWADIGERACIGSAVTLFKATIAPGEMVAPGSLLGDWGRMPASSPTSTLRPEAPSPPSNPAPTNFSPETIAPDPTSAKNPGNETRNDRSPENNSPHNSPTSATETPPSNLSQPGVVYGKEYFLQMRTALFS